MQALKTLTLTAVIAIASMSAPSSAAEGDDGDDAGGIYAGLELRGIGPAMSSGRITDFAVTPGKTHEFYVATASGGVWKTVNAGITWTPIFDDQGSYAIGVVELDPDNPATVWVGSGENNSQRSVGYGDGVYKSTDGGKSWTNMGLKNSEHISQIVIDPRDSDVVYVAAQGPLWNAGGDRGLYKTEDGGKSWRRVLHIDDDTGVNEVVMDPRHPDHLIASSYQRRRHVWTLIDGGPGGGIHKSTDGGQTWTRIEKGLPKEEMGRIGLALAPSDPDTVYAIIESEGKEQGLYRSTDFGDTWEKRSDYMTSSPQYYNELVVDPEVADRVYALDTRTMISEDGGENFTRLGIEHKHVDEHVLWIDPGNTSHLLAGNDGGIYESFDRGANWRHAQNLPITQFYRATADNEAPFYNVYGGTQDNNSLGAPSRTTSIHGITNSDWLVTLGGDGFETVIDPTDANVIYSQLQYGVAVRYDRRSGERIFITPQAGAGEPRLRWNWNSPLIISPHDHERLYFAAERVFRSDDQGNNWRPVSPDLSRGLDRNALKVMGRVWSVDTVAKNKSTSIYGSVISFAESPLVEGLLYAGTDDGLIRISGDGGQNWRRVEGIRGAPEMSYVGDLEPSLHDPDTVFVTFDNHKRGDFKPYVFKSTDRGRKWRPISGDLPERGTVHSIVQDHVDRGLIFAGTEFGLYFTQNGGQNWMRLKGNFPTIAVRDLDIQRRESDLVVATFGRGIYILDDYTPLRTPVETVGAAEATLFPVRDARLYMETSRWGNTEKGSQGATFFTAPNPPFGAVFTYHLRDGLKKQQEIRREGERETAKAGGDTPYPSWDTLRAEDREEDPVILFTISDGAGNVVRRLTGPTKKGLHRVAWDLRLPSPEPVELDPKPRSPWRFPRVGPAVLAGKYKVEMAKRVGGELVVLGEAREFNVSDLGLGTFTAADLGALQEFQNRTAALRRAVLGAVEAVGEFQGRIDHLKQAIVETPAASEADDERLRAIEARLADAKVVLVGDDTLSSRSQPAPWSIEDRVSSIVSGHWRSTSEATGTQREAYRIAAEEFTAVLAELKSVDGDLKALEQQLDAASAPWTPGRLPDWKRP